MDNKERLSAFYDNELHEDSSDLLQLLQEENSLSKELKGYSLISSIMQQTRFSLPQHKANSKLKINLITHSFAAAAAIFLTLGFITFFNPAQFDYDEKSSQLLADAIASEEGQIRLNQDQDILVDHLFRVMDERNLNTNMSPGWVPVGFSQNKEKPAIFSNGPKKFVLHVENSNVSLTKPIYWKKGNNLVYLHPTTDGKIITVYGNIRPAEAQKIVFSLKR